MRKQASELVPIWEEAVKLKYAAPNAKFSAVGYCFGAPFVLQAGTTGGIGIVAGAVAHPAFLSEDHFQNVTGKTKSIIHVIRLL